jgi:hypothetical protein
MFKATTMLLFEAIHEAVNNTGRSWNSAGFAQGLDYNKKSKAKSKAKIELVLAKNPDKYANKPLNDRCILMEGQ